MGNSTTKNFLIVILLLFSAVVTYKAYGERTSVIDIDSDPFHVNVYSQSNQALKGQSVNRVIMAGDSIISRWRFPNTTNGYFVVNRGISGEMSDILVSRFTSDVIELNPRYIVFITGINDVVKLYYYNPVGVNLQGQKVVSNIRIMAKAAQEKSIKPIICSLLPVNSKFSLPAKDINSMTKTVNADLEAMAKAEGFTYIDFWPVLIDATTGEIRAEYCTDDGIHPNDKGYEQMWSILAPQIKCQGDGVVDNISNQR